MIHGRRRIGCRRDEHPRMGRRDLLQAGGMSLVGMGLGDLLRLEAEAAAAIRPGTAKSVVFIFQSGGPSQHETFDPKPEANLMKYPGRESGLLGPKFDRLAADLARKCNAKDAAGRPYRVCHGRPIQALL